jgi:uncharacterized membrane protein
MTNTMPVKTVHHQTNTPKGLIAAGVIFGMGQAGFFDGIVLHQILQWHHMFSNIESDQTIAGLELNTLGDGLFHLLDWVLTLTGLLLLWQASRKEAPLSVPTFLSAALMGIGVFNLLEGIVDHHLLKIHHVKAGLHQSLYDLSLLAISAGIGIIGWLLLRRQRSLLTPQIVATAESPE